MEELVVKADVLCIGGGIAGLMAAIRASELGAKVVIAEKGNALHSGAARAGTDHFRCYIPEVHGPDPKPIIAEYQRSQVAGMKDIDFLHLWVEKSFEMVKLWDSWGIPMKYKGQWEFHGHSYPGNPIITLHYSGQNQKAVLTKKALASGAEIMNRVMVFDLLRDGDSIIGAMGVHTRGNKVIVFQAKSVILGTGRCERLYPGPTPGWMFNIASSATNTGDGRAMAYRAGAELCNIEMPSQHCGPKYFARSGQATWVGVLRDPQGKPVGPFVTKPNRKYGDKAGEANKLLFQEYAKSGRGPVYMDCGGISDEDYEYMMYFLLQEGNFAVLNHMREEGIDPRKKPVEFMTYELRTIGGVYHNVKSETNLKGLYAAGDEFPGGISTIPGATIHGYVAGENAANYAKEIEAPNVERARATIEEWEKLISQIRGRDDGPSWQEANIAVQQVMYDYAGSVRNESLLRQGFSHLQRIKDKLYSTMMARNPHELGRCLEVLSLLDVGEVIFITASERKETRGLHVRPDYPFTNPALEKLLIVKKVNDKAVTEWREIKH